MIKSSLLPSDTDEPVDTVSSYISSCVDIIILSKTVTIFNPYFPKINLGSTKELQEILNKEKRGFSSLALNQRSSSERSRGPLNCHAEVQKQSGAESEGDLRLACIDHGLCEHRCFQLPNHQDGVHQPPHPFLTTSSSTPLLSEITPPSSRRQDPHSNLASPH